MKKYNSQYEEYEKIAKVIECDTQIAGRYSFQKEDEKRIVPDILGKLNINSSDSLLEIGCGTGNLLIPLSFYVSKAVGIDNKNAIQKLLSRANLANLEGFVGNFLTYDTSHLGKFNKILMYSVLHYLSNRKEVYCFIDKALTLLDEEGVLVIGDIPNTSLKNNFLKSDVGKEFTEHWQERMKKDISKVYSSPMESYVFNDENIFDMMKHIKKQGYRAYLLPQPSNLPFGYTREDLIVSTF